MAMVSQLWDMIETWSFREDIKDVKSIGLMMKMTMHCNEEEDNDEVADNNFKDISALGLNRDLGFSQGHQ